jgi:hypothetical protein
MCYVVVMRLHGTNNTLDLDSSLHARLGQEVTSLPGVHYDPAFHVAVNVPDRFGVSMLRCVT